MAPSLDTNTVWMVTGCSTGLGKAIATYVHNAGHNIVATARNVESLTYLPDSPKVLKLNLDVTSKDTIASAFLTATKQFGRIDVVINNAGFGSVGELEGFPEDLARLSMETMFWGPVNVTRESLKVFREVNAPGQGGTIVQVSSIGGYLAYEGNCFYHASKFALEGFTKSVAREVNPKWNIKFLILSPGVVKTDFVSNMKYTPRHPAYADDPESPLNGLIKFLSTSNIQESWASAEGCATVLFHALVGQNERPLPRRLNLGAETLPIMRADVKDYSLEMDEWEKETLRVSPAQKAGESLLDVLQR